MSAPLDNSGNLLQRMVNAVEQVRQRLLRAAGALRAAGIDYAVVGGNAVAAWVATVDEAAVRNTQDVDIMIRPTDFAAAVAALEGAGFVYRRAAGLDLLLDHAAASQRQAVHLIFAGKMVRAGEPSESPAVEECVEIDELSVLNLDSLVRINLAMFRAEERMHLLDLIDVGLVEGSWIAKLPPVLAERLQLLLDTPEG